MKCPICNGDLEQETYYSEIYEDTSYYNYCPNCGYDDYPDEYEDEYESETTCKNLPVNECDSDCANCDMECRYIPFS